jgi:hypothetical protein
MGAFDVFFHPKREDGSRPPAVKVVEIKQTIADTQVLKIGGANDQQSPDATGNKQIPADDGFTDRDQTDPTHPVPAPHTQ